MTPESFIPAGIKREPNAPGGTLIGVNVYDPAEAVAALRPTANTTTRMRTYRQCIVLVSMNGRRFSVRGGVT
jgi:hypothetical protein